MNKLGKKLKTLRESKDITQQSLSDELYVSRQTISRYECGERYADLLMLKKLSKVLDICQHPFIYGLRNVRSIYILLSITKKERKRNGMVKTKKNIKMKALRFVCIHKPIASIKCFYRRKYNYGSN